MSPAELKQLVRSHQRELWRYLRFLGAEPREAESLLRETFLEASKRPPEQAQGAAVAAYLRSVARHKLVTALKRVGRQPAVPDLDQADAEWFLFAGASGGEERIERLRQGGDPLQDSAEGSIDRIRLLELFQQEASGQLQPPDVWRRLKRRTERPAEIGGYRIVDEIAAGAMGVVYRAHDPNMNRQVAIKLIRSEKEDERHRKRFRAEARALAKLNHPNVVRVHSAGDYEGSHYMVMAFVQGESLQERLDREGPIPDRELGELMVKLAEALEHCHSNAVLHRDLKPLNILIDHNGEPLLTDFGLASDLEAGSGSAVSFIGTPGYWPPEQARGKTELFGPKSDVYGLGATIYACLTQRPPYGKGASLQDTLELMQKPLEPPSATRPVDPSLEAICLRCLAEEPDDRFATAAALAADLQRFLDGRPVESSASSPSAPAARPRKRWTRSLLVGVALGAAVLLVAGGALMSAVGRAGKLSAEVANELQRLEASGSEATAELETLLRRGRAGLRADRVEVALESSALAVARYEAWSRGFEQLQFEQNKVSARDLRGEQGKILGRLRVEATVLGARALLRQRRTKPGALEQAMAILTPLAGVEDWCARLALAEGELLEAQGKLDEATQRFARSHQVSGRLFEGYVAEARALIAVDRLDDALLTLDGALQELGKPADGRERDLRRDLLLARSRARRIRGRAAGAAGDAELAARFDRGWRPLALLGRAHAAAGREPEALEAFERAVAAAPDHAGPQVALAEGLRALGRGGAYAAADRAVQADPLAGSARVLRAELAVELGRADALSDVQAALLQVAGDSRAEGRARRALALLHVYAGKDSLALKELKTARAVDPSSWLTRQALTRLELSGVFQGQFLDQALARWRALPRWRREQPEQRWWFGLAQLARWRRQPTRARSTFEQVLVGDPQHDGALAGLALTLQALTPRDEGQERKRLLRSAHSAWLKAVRAGRDPRRPAGRAYARGLHAERQAEQGEASAKPVARQAFLRAVWLRPQHGGAALGLARLAEADADVLQWIRRARVFRRAAAPLAAHAAALSQGRMNLPDRELAGRALRLRGATWKLLALQLRIKAQEGAKRDLLATLRGLSIGFEALRRRFRNRTLELIKAELTVIEALRQKVGSAQAITSRVDMLGRIEKSFEHDRKRLTAQAEGWVEQARRALAAKDTPAAQGYAARAVAKWPWSSAAWSALGATRSANGNSWGALTAHLLAGDGDLAAVLDALRRAGEAPGALPSLLKNLARPLTVDERTLLESAPIVARAFAGQSVAAAAARSAFGRLEALAAGAPQDLRAPLLLGVLAFGVKRNDYAVRELAFVSTVANASRTWYLAGVASARRPGALHASRAVVYLQEALRGDPQLLARAKADPELAALRQAPVWALLGS